MPYQFNAVDGGERCSNNLNYYLQLGLSASTVGTFDGSSFFESYLSYSPPNFSSATFFTTHRLYMPYWGSKIAFQNSAGQAQISCTFNSNGSITVSSGGNVIGTSAANIVFLNTKFFLAIGGEVNATAGYVSLQLNGNPVNLTGASASGINTAPYPTNLPITNIAYSSGESFGFCVRDISIHDGTGPAPFNGLLPPGGCVWLPAASLISAGTFAPNGLSTLVENAANTPPNPTVDFDSSSTVGDAVTFGITQLPSNALNVIAACAVDYSYKSDTGTRALQKSLKFGSAVVEGTENYLAESAVCYQDPWVAVDPNSGTAFFAEGSAGVTALNTVQLTETVAV